MDYPPSPLVYEDVATQTVFYVETDRCHLTAVRKGKVLWVRDMCTAPGRDGDSLGRITFIGGDSQPGYVGIGFNTGEFGRFRTSNGDFVDEGCD